MPSGAGFESEVDGGVSDVVSRGVGGGELVTVTGGVGPGPPVCAVWPLVTTYVITSATTTTPASAAHNAIHRFRWDFAGWTGIGVLRGPVDGPPYVPVGGPP